MKISGTGTQCLRRGGAVGWKAFTLLEVLLALAIFAGVLAAIYSSWSAILRGSQVAHRAAEEVQRSRVAVRALEEALSCAQLFAANSRYYGFVADTSEDDAALSFVAYLPSSYPRSGRYTELPVRRVEFLVDADPVGNGKRLVLRQTPLLYEPDPDEEQNPLVLATDVAVFGLEFFGANAREWSSEWTVTNQLPRLVRFTLAIAPRDAHGVSREHVITRVVTLPAGGTPVTVGGAPGAQRQPPPGLTNLPPVNPRTPQQPRQR